MPSISVIVPVYKTAKYMRKCIDSILNQTLTDLEVILVSDGPEEEHKICDEYALKDNRIKVIKDIGKGLGGARNAGMEIANSAYIAFVDSDDWIEPETYENALQAIELHKVDLVCWYAKIIPDKGFENESFLRGMEDYHKIKLSGLEDVDDNIIMQTPVTAWNKLYKKSIIEKNNIKFPESSLYEDNEFFFKYALFSKTAYYVDKYYYNYFQRDNSLMQNLAKGIRQTLDCISVYWNVYKWYEDRNALSEYKKLLCSFFKDPLYKYQLAQDKKFTGKKLIKMSKKINNKILEDELIGLVQSGKLYKIPFLDVAKYDIGNRILGFKYSSKGIVIYILGLKIKIKKVKV